MPNPRPFRQVDVFAPAPLTGNPVAVVHEAGGLSTEQMQALTDWTNLSEATFLLPPTDPAADYAVRIFSPGQELPFAGHPTLGTCHAWLEAGGQPRGEEVVQECGVGLVRIRRNGRRLAFAAPPRRRSGPLADADVARIVQGLGLAPEDVVAHEWCDNGPPWQAVLLRSAELVRQVAPRDGLLDGLFVGVVGPQQPGSDTAFEVRAFFPGGQAVTEDPVTGSLNAAVGQWLIGAGLAPSSYVAAQGTMLDRQGRVFVDQIGDDIWIGGECITVFEGTATL